MNSINGIAIKLFIFFVLCIGGFGGYQAWKNGYINLDIDNGDIHMEEVE